MPNLSPDKTVRANRKPVMCCNSNRPMFMMSGASRDVGEVNQWPYSSPIPRIKEEKCR